MKKRDIFIIIILLIILISLVVLISTKVFATTYNEYSPTQKYKIGDIVGISYNDRYKNHVEINCIEELQDMYNENSKNTRGKYKVTSVINIDGKISTGTGDDGKTLQKNHYSNAVIAYIAASSDPRWYGPEPYDLWNDYPNYPRNPQQYAVWQYMLTWFKNVGQYYKGLETSDTQYNSELRKDLSLYNKAIQYADKLEDMQNATINNVTAADKGVNKYTKVTFDGKEYIRIGPFKFEFPGNLSSIKLYQENGSAISGVIFSMSDGTSQVKTAVKNIKSKKNFYIYVPTSTTATKVTKIEAKISYTQTTAELVFFEMANSTQYQNLVRMKGEHATKEKSLIINCNIPVAQTGGLKIIKQDAINGSKLQNVKFVVQYNGSGENNGKYVNRDTSRKNYICR